MEDFTPDQLVTIANGYRDTARALNEFQVAHWPELSHEQQLDLNAYQNSLLNRAQDLQTGAVKPAFDNVATLATTLQQATDRAKAGLQHIKNITLALNVGAITVALASYVARANLRGVTTALRELSTLLTTEE